MKYRNRGFANMIWDCTPDTNVRTYTLTDTIRPNLANLTVSLTPLFYLGETIYTSTTINNSIHSIKVLEKRDKTAVETITTIITYGIHLK